MIYVAVEIVISKPRRKSIKRFEVNIPIGAAALARSRGDAGEQPAAGKLNLQVRIKFLSLHPLGYLLLHVLAFLLLLWDFSLLQGEQRK